MGLISKVRALLRSGAADPVISHGATYKGIYEPSGSEVIGTVADPFTNNKYPPAAVLVIRDGVVAAATEEFESRGNAWRFRVQLQEPVTPTDVVRERIRVFAVDHKGSRSELVLEGAIQLSFVREALAPPSETEIDIDFAEGGNSRDYLRDGWSGQESTHIWTLGKRSTIAVTFKKPGCTYKLEMLAGAFTVAGKVPGQTLFVSIDERQVGVIAGWPGQNLLQCTIPPEATQASDALLRLDLPDAVRPCDVTDNTTENRMVAFAFRRLKLKRLL